MELVIASLNVHKIREFRFMLKAYKQIDVLSLLDFPHYAPPSEDGVSFEEIVSQKALHAAKALKKWTLADDSGLIVPALKGAPGIYSARYAGEHATDAENRHKLLREMKELEEPQREAHFECWIAVASPEKLQKCVYGRCEGTILLKEKGSLGFGYDPLFLKHEYGKSFAELDEALKNRISHRRKALDKLDTLLSSLCTT